MRAAGLARSLARSQPDDGGDTSEGGREGGIGRAPTHADAETAFHCSHRLGLGGTERIHASDLCCGGGRRRPRQSAHSRSTRARPCRSLGPTRLPACLRLQHLLSPAGRVACRGGMRGEARRGAQRGLPNSNRMRVTAGREAEQRGEEQRARRHTKEACTHTEHQVGLAN